MTGGEAPAPLLLSSPALPAFAMVIAVLDDGKLLFLTCSAGEFRQFCNQSYTLLLPLGKSELLSDLVAPVLCGSQLAPRPKQVGDVLKIEFFQSLPFGIA
jgi:hypothetical protein